MGIRICIATQGVGFEVDIAVVFLSRALFGRDEAKTLVASVDRVNGSIAR